MWREILEFRDALPPSRPAISKNRGGEEDPSDVTAESVTRVENSPVLPRHRATTGVRRYLTAPYRTVPYRTVPYRTGNMWLLCLSFL